MLEAAAARYPATVEPLDVLTVFGGFEIAILVASRMQPALLDYCAFPHCSDERGHRHMLDHLDTVPLLQLGLRLGEGSGSALAPPLLHAAVNSLRDRATFESAQVSGTAG